MGGSAVDARVQALVAALAPYAWRDLTERMLVRRAVGAADRHVVIGLLRTVPGIDAGADEPVEPVDPGDERVELLVRVLTGSPWRRRALDDVCQTLVAAMDLWHSDRAPFRSGARRPVDDG